MSRRAFLFISFSSPLFAYKDMRRQSARARDLNMRTKDYTFAMSFAGLLVGSLFGLFLWKMR